MLKVGYFEVFKRLYPKLGNMRDGIRRCRAKGPRNCQLSPTEYPYDEETLWFFVIKLSNKLTSVVRYT